MPGKSLYIIVNAILALGLVMVLVLATKMHNREQQAVQDLRTEVQAIIEKASKIEGGTTSRDGVAASEPVAEESAAPEWSAAEFIRLRNGYTVVERTYVDAVLVKYGLMRDWAKRSYTALGEPAALAATNTREFRNYCADVPRTKVEIDRQMKTDGFAHANSTDLLVWAATEKTLRSERTTFALAELWRDPRDDGAYLPNAFDVVADDDEEEPARYLSVSEWEEKTPLRFHRQECVLGVREKLPSVP